MESRDYLKINEILQNPKITLHTIADKSGIRVENLHTIFKSNTTIDTLKRIANALDYKIEDLVKQRIYAHGYISYTIAGVVKNKIWNDLETMQNNLKSIVKIIRKNALPVNEKSLHVKFIEVVESRGYKLAEIVEAINIKNGCNTTKQNLLFSLQKNPTIKTLVYLSEILDIELSELLSDDKGYKIQGVVVVNGDVITLNSISDLIRAQDAIKLLIDKTITTNETTQIIDEILLPVNYTTTEVESYDISDIHFKDDDLKMDKSSTIDSSQELCYSFRKKGDTRDGKLLNFSNMLKGYPFEFLGKTFNDSECAYISGFYTSNHTECFRIQHELSDYEKGGYNAKADYRKANVEKSKNTPYIRADWTDLNCNFHWMLLVLWEKVNHNEVFRNMLMEIPINAHLIEDTSYHNSTNAQIWGCKNLILKDIRKSIREKLRSRLIEKGVIKLKTLNEAEQLIDNKINNIGIWEGQNATGKALKLCQIALVKGELPPFDLELINSKNIYWFGSQIELYIEDNKVEYRNV